MRPLTLRAKGKKIKWGKYYHVLVYRLIEMIFIAASSLAKLFISAFFGSTTDLHVKTLASKDVLAAEQL